MARDEAAAAAAPMTTAAMLAVEVAYSPAAGEVDCVALSLPPGATVADALRASGLLQRHGLDAATLRVGVWCRVQEAGTLLRDRDRVEIYRPLLVDPKEARRQRYKRHRQRTAPALEAGATAVKTGAPPGG
jgi:putative ubiquitin-RnfH superfamily antitoxin RatB of RatAB toxin-antitoxin module